MTPYDESDVIRELEGLTAIEPSPQTIQVAIERARSALKNCELRQVASPSPLPGARRKKIAGIAAVLMAVATVLVCLALWPKAKDKQANQVAVAEPEISESDIEQAVARSNQFAGDLYGQLSAGNSENVVISPYGVLNALQIALAGAKGETQQQMAKVMHSPSGELNPHAMAAALRTALAADLGSQVKLTVANRLWLQSGFEILPSFLETARIHYGAQPTPLDFSSSPETARQTINAWIEEQTERKIRNLISPEMLRDEPMILLTSAVYFKARWSREFSPSKTTTAPFRVSATRQVQAPMMQSSRKRRYAETKEMQIVELPYGEDERCSMLIMLPRDVGGLAGLEKRLTRNLNEWSSPELAESEVIVRIPRFEFSQEYQLRDVLGSMGMPLAFDRARANFSGISYEQKLCLSAVVHKTYVKVDEEGSEAAAGTAAPMPKSARARDPIEFNADHPFVFLIRENSTKTILFIGRVVNPND